MNTRKRKILLSIFLGTIIFVFTVGIDKIGAQPKYPTRSIELIIPMAPGGATDVTGRIIADALSKRWKVLINPVNKPGGNTIPAALDVHRATPDGYTMLMDGLSGSGLLVVSVKDLPFKLTDRTYCAIVAHVPNFIIVHPPSPYKSLKDLEIEAKKNPSSFTWTSLGGAGTQDYIKRQFFKAIGVDVKKTTPVMCKGGAEALTLTAGGHVKMGNASAAAATPAIRGGLVRALAFVDKERSTELPDIPTTAEVGYPTVNVLSWYGVSGPPNLPRHIVDFWGKELETILKDSEVISRFKKSGVIPYYLNSSAAKEHVLKEIDELERMWELK